MKVLVLNCGSSSVKYKLFDMAEKSVLVQGMAERIGMDASRLLHKSPELGKQVLEYTMPTHQEAVEGILQVLVHQEYGVISSVLEIDAVGHRVVHGGENFHHPVAVDDEVLKTLEGCSELAPLHNPPNIMGIKVCRKLMPHSLQVAIFDTAFHQTMPDYAYMYALPYEYYTKYRVRKYGFHGTSHKYVSQRAADVLDRDLHDLKMVTCHLGNGASLCAVKEGKALDTTMGFTPLAGLVMGTRCGNLDPAIVPFLAEKENMSWVEVTEVMNKKSGVLGISGLSSDFRDLEQAAEGKDERARLALDLFIYSVIKEIGALSAVLGGLDVLVFTAGIGENSPVIRRRVCEKLAYLGIKLDQDKNNTRGEELEITTAGSGVKVLVVPTNEELMIAEETLAVVASKKGRV